MSNCSRPHACCSRPEPPTAQVREVPVRRWPHPIPCAETEPTDAVLRAIRCELALQSRLLSELCCELTTANDLLEQIVENTAPAKTQE